MLGPGKYDHLATQIREAESACAVVVLVLGGTRGHGVSAQIDVPRGEHPKALAAITDMLGELVREMEMEIARAQ